MIRFDVDGKAHFALRYLADCPATAHEVWEAAGLSAGNRRKLAFMLGILRDRMLLTCAGKGGAYSLTDEGREALASLNAGEPLVLVDAVPSVRVFGRAA